MSKTCSWVTGNKPLGPCTFGNMRLFYEEERNEDFFNVCESIRAGTSSYISVSDIVKQAVHCPAKSFYLSARACYMIIRGMKGNKPVPLSKRELYGEVYSRYLELSGRYPDMPISRVARTISEQDAPRFYISAPRALNLYYKLLKKPSRP